ncbi:MAG: SRPBCC family protein [Actinomycetota bacterium]|nr:SRPBCC family protein [Actinomycetota bacterium]
MAEQVSERIHIDAPPARTYEVATDFERYPDWAKDVKQADVLERDAEGRGAQVEYRAAAFGRSARYVLQYDYSQAPGAFSWTLVEGEMVRTIDGTYRFDPDGDGTRVSYDLAIDPSIPLPGFLKRRTAGMIVSTALKELKKAVESS